MFIARWKIDAKFGHKDEVIESVRRWQETVGADIGWTRDRVRIITGSIGALESTVETEVRVDSLEALQKAWDKLPGIQAHQKWSKELEPHVVSGSHRWEIYRVL